MAGVGGGAVRRMPLIYQDKRELIFRRMETIRETIIEKYHASSIAIDLAKAIANGKRTEILQMLSAHPGVKEEIYAYDGDKRLRLRLQPAETVLCFLKEVYLEIVDPLTKGRTISLDDVKKYHNTKEKLMHKYDSELSKIPETFKLIEIALAVLPKAMAGTMKADVFTFPTAWIGENVRSDKPAKIVLALSGGSAKGVFYTGFLRALQENELWPDFVVGTSVGAIAAAALATGKGTADIEKALSIKALKRVFSPISVLFTVPLSLFSGFVGLSFGMHLRKIFGKDTFSDMADCFVVASVQQPAPFGKTVIGRASRYNGNLSMSSDIPIWKAVLGSAAMQGIIPNPRVRDFTAERLVGGELGVRPEGMSLPYANLDDGGVVADLPIRTADLLLKETGKSGLIIAVNLKNLNHIGTIDGEDEYITVNQFISAELEKSKWYMKPLVPLIGIGKWFVAASRRALRNIAPLRAYSAYEIMAEESILQTLDIVRGEGMKILLNPNNRGQLDNIKITDFSEAEKIKAYGYRVGRELAELLFGNGANVTDPT